MAKGERLASTQHTPVAQGGLDLALDDYCGVKVLLASWSLSLSVDMG